MTTFEEPISENNFLKKFPMFSRRIVLGKNVWGNMNYVSLDAVNEFCIEKQRVKEVLDKYMNSPAVVFDDEGFRKELNLE